MTMNSLNMKFLPMEIYREVWMFLLSSPHKNTGADLKSLASFRATHKTAKQVFDNIHGWTQCANGLVREMKQLSLSACFYDLEQALLCSPFEDTQIPIDDIEETRMEMKHCKENTSRRRFLDKVLLPAVCRLVAVENSSMDLCEEEEHDIHTTPSSLWIRKYVCVEILDPTWGSWYEPGVIRKIRPDKVTIDRNGVSLFSDWLEIALYDGVPG